MTREEEIRKEIEEIESTIMLGEVFKEAGLNELKGELKGITEKNQQILKQVENKINKREDLWENRLKDRNRRNIPQYQNFLNTQYIHERLNELKELKQSLKDIDKEVGA